METKPLHLYSNFHFVVNTTHLSPSKNHFFNTTTPKRPKLYNPKTTTIHSTYKNGGGIQCPVPFDQQPIIEYQNISTSFPFSWARSNLVEFSSRLFVIGLSFSLLLGLPVSFFGSVAHHPDPFKLLIGSASTGLFVVILIVLRMYLGWAYVGNRLLSATVEYEETGWYDGQIWVKTAEVLARDRLLGSFQVKPVLNKLKNSLVALGIALFICVALFINYEGSQEESVSLSYGFKDGVIAGVYDDESARLFEPDAFCGGSGLVAE